MSDPILPMAIPPAWYPDPLGTSQMRWWDGARWTEHYAPFPPVLPPGAVVQAKPWPMWAVLTMCAVGVIGFALWDILTHL